MQGARFRLGCSLLLWMLFQSFAASAAEGDPEGMLPPPPPPPKPAALPSERWNQKDRPNAPINDRLLRLRRAAFNVPRRGEYVIDHRGGRLLDLGRSGADGDQRGDDREDIRSSRQR